MTPKPPLHRSPVPRSLLLLAATLASAIGLIVLQNVSPTAAAIMFIGAIAAWSTFTIYRFSHSGRSAFRTFWVAKRAYIYWGLGVGSVACMGLAAYCFMPANQGNLLIYAVTLTFFGGVGFMIALHGRQLMGANPSSVITQEVLTISPQSASLATPKWRLALQAVILLSGLVCLLCLIEINASFLKIPMLTGVSLHIQFALLCAALVGIAFGIGGFERSSRPIISTRATYLIPVICLFFITLLAFVVRLYLLGTAVHRFVDEVHFSTAVMTLLPGTPGTRLLEPFSGITAFPWLYPYLQSLTVRAFGRTLEGLRLVSVILGTLGIPAVYLLARALFDRRTALLAAFLLATFPPHIHFSRIGLNNIADPLFGTLALAFLVRGLRYNRRWDFALGGIALGLTQYFYEGGRFLFPALVIVWLAYQQVMTLLAYLWTAINRRRTTIATAPHKSRFRLLAFFLPAFLVALPIYTTLIGLHYPLDMRFKTVGVGGSYWLKVQETGRPQTFEQQLIRPLLVYVSQPETGLYYGGKEALVFAPLIPFLLLGVAALLAKPRAPGMLLLLLVAIASAGNMLLTESAISARYVVTFPALAIIMAVGLRTALDMLLPLRYPNPGRIMLLAAIAICLGAAQLIYYFGPHLQAYNAQMRVYPDAEDAMFRAIALPQGTQIHVYGDTVPTGSYLNGVVGYLADGFTVAVQVPNAITQQYVDGLSMGFNQAFFLTPDDGRTLAMLQTRFKNLQGPFSSPYLDPSFKQYWLYYAPAPRADKTGAIFAGM